jgi:hypothetical protein
MVLLDLVWNLKGLQTNRSGVVHNILMGLTNMLVGMQESDEPKEIHPLAEIHPGIEHALVSLVDAMAGQDAALYVNNFLDDYRGLMKIPVMEGFE